MAASARPLSVSGATNGAAYVYVFSESGLTWTQTTQYTDPNAQRYDVFGASTAISPPYVGQARPV